MPKFDFHFSFPNFALQGEYMNVEFITKVVSILDNLATTD